MKWIQYGRQSVNEDIRTKPKSPVVIVKLTSFLFFALEGMESDHIKKILYSAIRNATHQKVRVNGYIRKMIKLAMKLIFLDKRRWSNPGRQGILTFAPEVFFDWPELKDNYHIITNEHRNQDRHLICLEILLIIGFLVNVPWVQRLILSRCKRLVHDYADRHNLSYFICCHPDLLSACIGYFFNKMGKRVVTIQHGIYQLSSYRVLWFERSVATDVIVWGDKFKKMYETQGVDPTKVVTGAACLTFKQYSGPVMIPSQSSQKPVIIGQQLYKISSTVFEPYNEFIKRLINFYEIQGVAVPYRPHPREDVSISLSFENRARLRLLTKQSNQYDFINEYNLFYSVNSTLLIETFLNQRLSFQIDISIPDFKYDHFCMFTSIPVVNLSNLETHLEVDVYDFKMDSEYLRLSPDFQRDNVRLLFPTNCNPAS